MQRTVNARRKTMLVQIQPPEPTSYSSVVERTPDKGEVDGSTPSKTTMC